MECVRERILKKKYVSKIVTWSKRDFHIFLSPHIIENNLIRRLQFVLYKKHTHSNYSWFLGIFIEEEKKSKKILPPPEKKDDFF